MRQVNQLLAREQAFKDALRKRIKECEELREELQREKQFRAQQAIARSSDEIDSLRTSKTVIEVALVDARKEVVGLTESLRAEQQLRAQRDMENPPLGSIDPLVEKLAASERDRNVLGAELIAARGDASRLAEELRSEKQLRQMLHDTENPSLEALGALERDKKAVECTLTAAHRDVARLTAELLAEKQLRARYATEHRAPATRLVDTGGLTKPRYDPTFGVINDLRAI